MKKIINVMLSLLVVLALGTMVAHSETKCYEDYYSEDGRLAGWFSHEGYFITRDSSGLSPEAADLYMQYLDCEECLWELIVHGFFSQEATNHILQSGRCTQYADELVAAGYATADWNTKTVATPQPEEPQPVETPQIEETPVIKEETPKAPEPEQSEPEEEITEDTTVTGDYVCIENMTKAYADKKATDEVFSLASSQRVKVIGKTSNGLYHYVAYDSDADAENEYYSKAENFIGESEYENGWRLIEEDTSLCDEVGQELWRNDYTGEEKTVEKEATEHSLRLFESTATCTEDGTIIYTCDNCTYTKTEEQGALGHEGEWTTVKEKHLLIPGKEQNICLRCGEVLEERRIGSYIPLVVLIVVVVGAAAVAVYFIAKKNRNKLL